VRAGDFWRKKRDQCGLNDNQAAQGERDRQRRGKKEKEERVL